MVMVSLVPVRYTPIWPEPAKSYRKSENVIFCGDFAVNCEIDGKVKKGLKKMIAKRCLGRQEPRRPRVLR